MANLFVGSAVAALPARDRLTRSAARTTTPLRLDYPIYRVLATCAAAAAPAFPTLCWAVSHRDAQSPAGPPVAR